MDATEFERVTGHAPVQDDLERANCPRAGQGGHDSCGVCKEHGLPVFKCNICFHKAFSEAGVALR